MAPTEEAGGSKNSWGRFLIFLPLSKPRPRDLQLPRCVRNVLGEETCWDLRLFVSESQSSIGSYLNLNWHNKC